MSNHIEKQQIDGSNKNLSSVASSSSSKINNIDEISNQLPLSSTVSNQSPPIERYPPPSRSRRSRSPRAYSRSSIPRSRSRSHTRSRSRSRSPYEHSSYRHGGAARNGYSRHSRSPPPRYPPSSYNGHSRGGPSNLSTFNGHPIDPARVNPPESDVLAIFGLDKRATERDLMELFKNYGCKECKIIIDKLTRRPKGYGFIYFNRVRDAIKAKRDMHGRYLLSKPIRIDFSIGERDFTQLTSSSSGSSRRAATSSSIGSSHSSGVSNPPMSPRYHSSSSSSRYPPSHRSSNHNNHHHHHQYSADIRSPIRDDRGRDYDRNRHHDDYYNGHIDRGLPSRHSERSRAEMSSRYRSRSRSPIRYERRRSPDAYSSGVSRGHRR